jgi:hypothetical protein
VVRCCQHAQVVAPVAALLLVLGPVVRYYPFLLLLRLRVPSPLVAIAPAAAGAAAAPA